MYIGRLDKIVGKYSKKYNGTIKMKPASVERCMYIEYSFDHNDKNSKFKVGDHVRI